MITFRGQKKVGPRPDWSPVGVLFKISDEHPRLFIRESSPPPPGALYSSVEEDGLNGVVGFTVAFGLRLLSVFLFFHLGRKFCVQKVRGL